MTVRDPEYTPEEGQELSTRLERMRREGGVPHEVVKQEMLDDMDHDLRQMVAQYDGSHGRAKELLEALVIARAAGLATVDEIEQELGRNLLAKTA